MDCDCEDLWWGLWMGHRWYGMTKISKREDNDWEVIQQLLLLQLCISNKY